MTTYSNDNDDNTMTGASVTGATLDANAPVLVFMAGDNEEADVARATLAGAGIPALLQSPSVTTFMGAVDAVTSDTHNLGLWVAPSHAEAARALLNAPAPSDAELSAEVDADPLILEQAEANVKNA